MNKHRMKPWPLGLSRPKSAITGFKKGQIWRAAYDFSKNTQFVPILVVPKGIGTEGIKKVFGSGGRSCRYTSVTGHYVLKCVPLYNCLRQLRKHKMIIELM